MKRNALLMLLFLVAAFTQVSAQAALSLQGTLQKSTGLTVEDGEYSLTFKLYTTEFGGVPVWTETQDAVDVVGGVYSVILGSVNPLTASFDQPYYLGITIGTGAEATPRARLTSSPYALSLIGQSNTFPSSGPVGVGTASPDAGVEMHVKDTVGEAKLLVESTANAPRLTLKRTTDSVGVDIANDLINFKSSRPYRFWHEGTGALNFDKYRVEIVSGVLNTNAASWSLQFNSQPRMTLNSSGVKINKGTLQFGDYVTYTNEAIMYYFSGPSIGTMSPYATIFSVQIDCGGVVKAGGFLAASDTRIKKDIKTSSHSDDLANLLRLRVADYSMKDEVKHGKTAQKGFIAQEVAEVLPAAVAKSKGVVPDIYAIAQSAEVKGEEMTIAIKDKHGLKIGDKVRLMSEKNNGGEDLYEVSRIDGENSFTVSGWTAGPTDKVFVYGREVDDFHIVNYDYIHTLNVSATQELARRVLELEAQNASLLQDKAEMKHQMDGLGQRLAKLENLVTGSAQR